MRKEVRVEGNEFTQRRKVVEVREAGDPRQTLEEMSAVFNAIIEVTTDPWKRMQPKIEKLKLWLDEERAAKPTYYRFVARVDTGWYLLEIVSLSEQIDARIAEGNVSTAICDAIELGELHSELQLMLAREKLYLAGLRAREGSKLGPAAKAASLKISDDTRPSSPLTRSLSHIFDPVLRRRKAAANCERATNKRRGYSDDQALRILKLSGRVMKKR